MIAARSAALCALAAALVAPATAQDAVPAEAVALRTMRWAPAGLDAAPRLRWSIGVQQPQPSPVLQAPPTGARSSGRLWMGLGIAQGENATLSLQAPMSTDGLNPARALVQESELHVGLKLDSLKRPRTPWRGTVRVDISSQTHILFKPRKNRMSVVLRSEW